MENVTAPVEKNSFKAMIKAGIIKRTDAGMWIRSDDIHVRPGFNLRDTTQPDCAEDDASLDAHIESGGHVPALEVVARPEGGVWIVEGHRRDASFKRRIAAGQVIEWIRIEPFNGNDMQQLARILTSQDNRKLKALEVAEGYRRLAAFGNTPDQIGAIVHKTRQHVEQLLILASGNADVHAMVSKGVVSAAIAIDAIRKHGEGAGEFLITHHNKAQAAGSGKITAKTMHGKALPRVVIDTVVGAVKEFTEKLPAEVRKSVANAWAANDRGEACDEMVEISAFDLAELMKGYQAIDDQAKKEADQLRRKTEKAAQKEIEGLRPKFPGQSAEEKAAAKKLRDEAKAADKLEAANKKAEEKLQKAADKEAKKIADKEAKELAKTKAKEDKAAA